MKFLRSHPRRRGLARLLTFLLLAPYLTVAPAPAVHAQRTNPDVYVLDFNNRTPIGGQLLGKVAAAQVSLQLSESNNWNVAPDAQVQRRIQELNLRQPFDRVARVQIASGVDATEVVYGDITDARVTTSPDTRAYVKIQVLVEDIRTGELVNGAIADAYSTPRMGFSGDADVLLEEALGKAAFKAREFMDRFRLPEGTVLNTTVIGSGPTETTDALLNIGARQGVRRGMIMIVTRQRDVVGRLRVTNVDSEITTARVIENNLGVRPEDRARAIFSFADFPVTRSRTRAMAPAAGVLLASSAAAPQPTTGDAPVKVSKAARNDEFLPARARTEGGTQLAQATTQAPPPVVVDEPTVDRDTGERASAGHHKLISQSAFRMLVGGLLVLGILAIGGQGGANAQRPSGVDAFAFQYRIGAPGAVIRVHWDRPRTVPVSSVAQYVIYRADTTGNLQIVGATQGDTLHSFDDTEAVRTLNNVYTSPPGTIGPTAATVTNAPGITPGQQYRYQIATVFYQGELNNSGSGGTTTGTGTGNGNGNGNGNGTGTGAGGNNQGPLEVSPLSVSTPWVTAIAPPLIVQPTAGQQVNLAQLNVTWQKSAGADQYLIWISKDQRFSNKAVFGPFQASRPEDDGNPTASVTIDARSAKLASSSTAYITVGAYSSVDQNRPRPFGAIFSPPVAMQPQTSPPPPPGAPGHSKGTGDGTGLTSGNGHKGKGKSGK